MLSGGLRNGRSSAGRTSRALLANKHTIVEKKIMIAQDRLSSRHSVSNFSHAAKAFASAVVQAYQLWRNRREVRRLQGLSDRELDDIGLQRSDVERALMVGWRTDASERLAEIRHERRRAAQRRRDAYARARYNKMTL